MSAVDNRPISEVLPTLYLSPPISAPKPVTSQHPLQVYHPHSHPPTATAEDPVDSAHAPTSSPTTGPLVVSEPIDDSPEPIATRKGIRSTRNPNPIYTFLSYHRLSSPYYAFVSHLSSIAVPKTTSEALSDSRWRQAMIDEMEDRKSVV